MNKRLRQSLRTAEQMGICLVCGPGRPCTCQRYEERNYCTIRPVRRDHCRGLPARTWAVCRQCKTLIALPKPMPAVRCPGCYHVN